MRIQDRPEVTSGADLAKLAREKLQQDAPWVIGRIGGSDFEAVAYHHLKKAHPFDIPKLAYASRGSSIIHQSRCRQLNGYFGSVSQFDFEEYLATLHESWLDSDILLYAGKPLVDYFENGAQPWFGPYAHLLADAVRTSSYSFVESVYPFLETLQYLGSDLQVLVVSPFSRSVRHQHESGLPLVSGYTYPRFRLSTLDVPVTYSSLRRPMPVDGNWFDTLDFLKSEVSKLTFDLALVSAGSYAGPLLSHIKSLGKKGVYIGGMLNVLFNLSGQRYDQPQYARYSIPETRISPFETHEILRTVTDGRSRRREALLAYLPEEPK